MIKIMTASPRETEELGAKIAAGKTAFTRGLCKGLDISDGVSSPTFAIVNVYNGRFPVYHFDMYRIADADDLFATGYYDYIGNGVIVIEWSENIEIELESDAIRIRIGKTEHEDHRVFEIEGLDHYADIIR